MTRHPAARRVHQDKAGPDDAFIARTLEFVAWAKSNTRTLIATGGAVILLVLAGGYYINFKQVQGEQAASQLNAVWQTAASGNNALAIRDLEGFIQTFASTNAADEARILLAKLYLEEGQPDKAMTTVQALASKPKEKLGASAAFLLGAAYEAAGDPEKAESTYLQIADRAEFDYQRREALDHAARIRMERGAVDQAAELFQRLLEMTPETSPERGLYELRLGELKAKSAASKG